MILLFHLCVFLGLTAKCAAAGLSVKDGLGVMTVGEYTLLTCCQPDQNTSRCSFRIDSRDIGRETAKKGCCQLFISGQELLDGEDGQHLVTDVNIQCETLSVSGHNVTSAITITVWRLPFSGRHAVIFLLVLVALVLISLLIFTPLCIWYCVTNKGRKGKFHPVSLENAQELDTDTQGVNVGIEEEKEDDSEVAGDELFYATVNHTNAHVSSAVRFESGTDYATVVVN